MLYLRTWQGDETDWVTLTPQNPEETDSSEFDEGVCTGFAIPNHVTGQFISELLILMNRHGVTMNVI